MSAQAGSSSTTLNDEGTWFMGTQLAFILCGAVVTLSIQCLFPLVRDLKREGLKSDGLLVAFVVLTLVFSVVFHVTTTRFVQMQGFNGNLVPQTFRNLLPFSSASNITMLCSSCLADFLLLWRWAVIYRDSVVPARSISVLASVFGLTELSLCLYLVVQLLLSDLSPSVVATLAFWALSLALNVLITALIVSRLLIYGRRIANAIGPGHHLPYTSIVAMIIESEFFFTMHLIVFIILYILNHPLVSIFINSLGEVQALSALLIVYRVAHKR